MATYTITKIKTFNGREGQGLNATICKDGKPICFVLDDASGGEVRFDYRNPLQNAKSFNATTPEMAKAAEDGLTEFCRAWYETSPQAEESRRHDAEMRRTYADWEPSYVEDWVNTLVDDYQTKKRFDRISKTKTLFRLAGDKAGEYRTIGVPYSDPRCPKFMQDKYGDKLIEIWGVDLSAKVAA